MNRESAERLIKLIGEDVDILASSRVTICGIGGVGGHVAESLARSFVGGLTFVDGDVVSLSNINRQAVARLSTVGKAKVDVMANIVSDINADADVRPLKEFITASNVSTLNIWDSDVIVDAIDDVPAKVALIKEAKKRGKYIISAMGAGNLIAPAGFKIVDISKTNTCPLAKRMRKALADEGIKSGVDVCFSDAERVKGVDGIGSTAFAPAGCGLTIAAEVVKQLILMKKQ